MPDSTLGRARTAVLDIDGLPDHWKFEVEGGSNSTFAFYADFPSMLLDNSVCNRQSEASSAMLPFTNHGLGSKERIVNTVDVFLRDSASGIADCNCDSHPVASHNAQCSPLRHGVLCIQEQVQKHLLQFAGISHDGRQWFVKFSAYFNLRGLELMLQQR